MPTATERSPRGEIVQSQTSLGFLVQFLRNADTKPVDIHFRGRGLDRALSLSAQTAIHQHGESSHVALTHQTGEMGRQPGLLGTIRFVDDQNSGISHVESFLIIQRKNPTHIPLSDDIEKVMLHTKEISRIATIPQQFRREQAHAEEYRYLLDQLTVSLALKRGKLPNVSPMGNPLAVADQSDIFALEERLQYATGVPILD